MPFYVATTGSDAADGSSTNPFATLSRAKVAMENSATKTTLVEGGTYSQALTLTSADNGVTFAADQGQSVVLNGAGLSSLVTMNGTQNVILQGMTFENTAGGYGGAIHLINASSNQIINNTFINNDIGVQLTASANNTVAGNEINNSVIAGVNANNASNGNTITNNLINGVRLAGSGTESAGIFLVGANSNTIVHNHVENTEGGGIVLSNWTSDTSTQNLGNTIAYNAVTNANSAAGANDSGAIYVLGRTGANTNTSIHDNLVTMASSPTTSLNVGIYLDDFMSGVTVTNNIVVGGNLSFLIHGGDNNALSNNIFDIGTRTAPNIGAGLIQGISGNPMTGDTVSQNIVYSTAAGSPNAWISYSGSASVSNNLYYNTNGFAIDTTSARYGSGNVGDSSPKSGNPQFANAAAGDYTLGAGSAGSLIGFTGIDQSSIGIVGGSSPPPPPPPPPVTTHQLLLVLSEDRYKGDAKFLAKVDGQQVGNGTVTAQEKLGRTQTFTFNGQWAVGTHDVEVDFLNDLADRRGDRNLYVDDVRYDGTSFLDHQVLMAETSAVHFQVGQ